MNLYEPFTGVLQLPDRAPFGAESPVTVADGPPVALISRHRFSWGAKFDILDPVTRGLLASGVRAGGWGRRYQVTRPGEQMLLELTLSGWGGVIGKSTVTLPDGRVLKTKGNWSARRFEVADAHGAGVGALVTTSRVFAVRPDSLAFELRTPVLSVIQAIGLAQCMRTAVETQRSSAAAAG